MCLPAIPAAAAAAGAAGSGAAAAGAATLSTFQIASLALGAGSTLLGAYGQMQAGKAQEAQANVNAQIARNNQIISERQAEDARLRGKNEENQHRIKIAQLKGRQKTALAASGIETDSGTALDVLADTAEIGELEALTIRNNAEREAVGLENQAANFGASSANLLASGEAASSAGNFGAATSLLSGAGSVASKWYSYRKGF